jgi:hypothetical protein
MRFRHRMQRRAGHQLHDNEASVVAFPDVVDGDDVGMVECRGRLGFLHEPADAVRVRVNSSGNTLMATLRFRRVSSAR